MSSERDESRRSRRVTKVVSLREEAFKRDLRALRRRLGPQEWEQAKTEIAESLMRQLGLMGPPEDDGQDTGCV